MQPVVSRILLGKLVWLFVIVAAAAMPGSAMAQEDQPAPANAPPPELQNEEPIQEEATEQARREAIERAILAQQEEEANLQRGRGGRAEQFGRGRAAGRGGRGRGGRGGQFGQGRGRFGGQFGGMQAEDLEQLFAAQRNRNDDEAWLAAQAAGEFNPLVAVNVWALTISVSKEQLADELVAGLAEKVRNLPVVIDSRGVVRELIDKLRVAGLVQHAHEYRLTTAHDESATVQIGAREPQVTSRTLGARGRSNAINYLSAGTTIEAGASVQADGTILIRLEYSASDVEKAQGVPIFESEEGERVLADRILNYQMNTTVHVRSGTAVVIQSDSSTEMEGDAPVERIQLLILAAAVVPTL